MLNHTPPASACLTDSSRFRYRTPSVSLKTLTCLAIPLFLAASSASSFAQTGVVEFDSPACPVNEQAAYRTVTVRRTGGSAGTISVNYATADGTASSASDYGATSGTLVFADGETEKVITVQISNEVTPVVETAETFSLTLTGAQVGTNATTVFTINDTPTISTIAAQTTPIGTGTAAIPFTVADPETAAADLTVTAFTTNPVLLPPGGIVLGGSEGNRTITLTPAAELTGTAAVTILVTDAGGAVAVRTFTLSVGNASAATALAITSSTPANAVPGVVLTADDSFTLNYTVTNSAWVTNVSFDEPDNVNLIGSHGTGSTSDLRTQPGTSGATARSLRVRGRDNSTEVGEYGTANVTLGFTGSGAPADTHTFNVRVNPRAVADNNLLAIPGTTSTFDVLANDAKPIAGHTFTISSVSTPAHGTLTITPDGKYVRYAPTNLDAYFDTFTYTVTLSSSDAFNGFQFTGIGYVKIGGYVVVDSPTASQHIDLDFDYINGTWSQIIRTDAVVGGSVQSGTFSPSVLDADEGILFFDPSTKGPRNAASSLDVLGVPAGADVWVGPSTSNGHKVYLGIANESTTGVDSYLPAGDPRVTTAADYVATKLVGFSGPGNFAAFNGSDVAFDTFDGLNSANDATSGGNPTDTFWGFSGSHAHPAWHFTAPGRYTLTFETTVRVGGVFQTSPPTTFYVDVDTISGNARLPENPPQTGADVLLAVEDGGAVSLSPLSNDTSAPDGYEVLTITAVAQGSNGSVAITGGGSTVSYTPAANFNGSDSFTCTITDEHGGTATTTANVTVTPVNDMPSFVKGANREHAPGTTGAQSFTNWATGISDGDAGVEQALTFNVNVTSGAAIFSTAPAISSDGTLSYTLNGASGIAQVSATLTDDATAGGAALTTAAQTFTITVASNGLVPFTQPSTLPIVPGGAGTYMYKLADLNGDGHLDVYGSFGLLAGINYGTGTGGFQTGVGLGGSSPFASVLYATDYDNDGDQDLLVSDFSTVFSTSAAVAIYLNNGMGQFTRQELLSGLSSSSQRFEYADVNGDGRGDIIQIGSSTTLAIRLGLAGGGFGSATTFYTGTGFGTTTWVPIRAVDLDVDGDLDLVAYNSGARQVLVFKNDVAGNFGAPTVLTVPASTTVRDVTDFNGDGRVDIFTTTTTAPREGRVSLQQPDGTFAPFSVLTSFGTDLVNYVGMADINQDGIQDLLSVAGTAPNNVLRWSPGLGGGNYGTPQFIDNGLGNIIGHTFADLDHDGRSDLILGTGTTARFMVAYLNKAGETLRVVKAPASRLYLVGENLDTSIYFGMPVTVTGTPRIALQIGSSTVYANYVSGSGTSTLVFRYTVTSSDLGLDGIQLASTAVDLNGGTLKDANNADVAPAFPATPFNGVVVNGVGVLVQNVVRLDPTPTNAPLVSFQVQFTEAVNGVDAADFELKQDAGDLTGASIQSVTGTGSTYQVSVSTGSGSGALALSVKDAATITNLTGGSLAKGYIGGQVYTLKRGSPINVSTLYTQGHADYMPFWDNGELTFILRADAGVLAPAQTVIPSNELLTYAGPASIATRPAASSYDFIGVSSGANMYLLPTGSKAGVPFLGFGAETVPGGIFARYFNNDPRVNSTASHIKMQVVAVRSSSGGHMSIYTESFGTPNIWVATTDGLGSTDALFLTPGSHSHYNTAFTQPGTYEVDVVVSGFRETNANGAYDPVIDPYMESGIQTMVFGVDFPAQWRQENFGSTAAAGNAASGADPEQDGLSNRLEYAFGLNPSASSTSPLSLTPGGTVLERGLPIVSGNYAVFLRRRDYQAAGLTYIPQISPDLTTWQPVTAAPEVIGSDAEMDLVRVLLPAAAGERQFFNVNVTMP